MWMRLTALTARRVPPVNHEKVIVTREAVPTSKSSNVRSVVSDVGALGSGIRSLGLVPLTVLREPIAHYVDCFSSPTTAIFPRL